MKIVIVGGGMAGLAAGLTCARSGHEVTILERDATPMPESPADAFRWERRGAPQVRHSHAFLARLRNLLRDRAPDVLEALLAAGATELPFAETLPETLTDRSAWPGDEELVALACRRTTFEWVLRRLVLSENGVELRDGVGVDADSLSFEPGVPPRLTGLAGIDADLVIDARGPRSNSDDWLACMGVDSAPEELHESGIVYFSRFYEIADPSLAPPLTGPAAADLGYIKFAVFVGDNGTFSITYAVDSRDDELRKRLADEAAFEAAALAVTPIAPWRAPGFAQPTTDVHVMAGLRNRERRFVVDEMPLVRGFLPVGDAAVCTNPLYGRGCSLAFVHAFGLADAVAEHGDDFDSVARSFQAFTDRELQPWFRAAVFQDEQARMLAAGEHLPAEDPRAFMQDVVRDGLMPAVRTSPLVFRAFLRWFNLLATPEALMGDPATAAEVLAAYHDRENRPGPPVVGPADRAEFLAQLL